jgi:hypothetical protein
MKNFRFESIWLLSRRDQRARKVNFATTNLIVGKNHTGKSSLIKTLFVTLGAKPAGDLARWDSNTISIVCFSIDGCRYYALHQNGLRALFAEDGKLAATAANYANWWPIIADLSGFNLVLPNKAGESAQADGSCFFLPFYVDQDGSWQVGWNTFPSIKQFKAPVLPTLEYFTGVKPPEWYALNAKKNETQVALSELKTEARILSSIRNRFANSMPTFGPKIDPRIFEQDIALLTAEMTALNAAQEKVRDAEVREREALSSARLQVDLAAATLQTYDQDSRFLRSTTPRPLVCPTCGAEHDKSFLSVLGYAEDARILRELVVRLRNDSEKAAAAYQKTHRELVELDSRYQRISDILSRRRGELRFDDVVKSMGAERAFGAFEEELAALNEQIDKKSGEIDRLLARQNELTDARRTKTIVGEFREKYATAT